MAKKKTKNYVAISFRHSFFRVRVQARARVSSRQKIFSATPSTPPTPNVCKHLIFRGHFQVFWVLGANLPNTQSASWVLGRVWGKLIPNTQNRHKYPLKIKGLRALGVGGVEGVGHSACMTTIYTRERFASQVQPKKVIGSAGFAIQLE